MFLLCFKNGSLARKQVRDAYGLDWGEFSRILLETAPGNAGRILLPYFQPEITPLVLEPGVSRYGGLAPEDAEGNIRAVAEAQIMSIYLHSDWTGPIPREILVTAGGSTNKGLLKLIAQVFGSRVRIHDVADGAALGAALRAVAADQNRPNLGDLANACLGELDREVVEAASEETAIYQGPDGLLKVYQACQAYHLGNGPSPREAIEAFRGRHD
jgi:sugar (pentulose or hexulose) kinase